MQKICCAVQRINNPERVRLARCARFLSKDGVLRVVLVDDVDDRGFGFAIRIADVIVMPLHLDFEFVELFEISAQYGSGAARRHHRHVK